MANAIAEYYEGATHEKIEQIVEGEIKVLEDKEESDVTQADLMRLTQDAPIVKVTNLLLAEAVKMRASDILIEPLEEELRVRYRVDGILLEGRKPPKKIHSAKKAAIALGLLFT